MRTISKSLVLIAIGLLLSSGQGQSQDDTAARLHILKLIGSEGRFVIPTDGQQAEVFRRIDRLDIDQDGTLSRTEFSEQDDGFTAEVRERIFNSADIDHDKSLTYDEFEEHLVVTDEARAIFATIDSNGVQTVSESEFIAHCKGESSTVARSAFLRLNADKNGSLTLPKFLATFSEWACLEQPPVTARLVAKQKAYPLPAENQTDAFRARIKSETDVDKLPPVPKVNLVLVIRNVSNEPVAVWPRGSVDEATVTVKGDGLVRPDSLQGAGGSSSGTTPQPIIQPGKTFRVKVRSLNPQENFIDNAYWTKPGEYQISASYPVYQNLPPHLPELFPNQPKPTGKPKRFHVTAPPITVLVTNEKP